MGNEIVDPDEIKDEVALLREKLKARGAETLHQKSKPNRKTQSKSTTKTSKEKKVSKIKEHLELLRTKLQEKKAPITAKSKVSTKVLTDKEFKVFKNKNYLYWEKPEAKRYYAKKSYNKQKLREKNSLDIISQSNYDKDFSKLNKEEKRKTKNTYKKNERQRIDGNKKNSINKEKAMVCIYKARKYGPIAEEKALEYYDKAAELAPNYYLIYKDRATLFHILKKFEKAVENYKLALAVRLPTQNTIHEEDMERALQKKLIQNPYPWKTEDYITDQTDEQKSLYWSNLADGLQYGEKEEKPLKEALDYYDKSGRKDNDTYKSKGFIYQKLGDWEKAIEWYNKIKDPHFGDSGEFWHMKAKCFSKLGNIENAVECLKNGRDRGGYPHIDYEEDARELANEEFNVSYGEDEE